MEFLFPQSGSSGRRTLSLFIALLRMLVVQPRDVLPVDVVHETVYVDSLDFSAEVARIGAKVVIAVVGPGCTAILRGALPTGMVAVTF